MKISTSHVALCLRSTTVVKVQKQQKQFVEAFGEKVRQARTERGISQEALADAAGLHRTHVSLIERGGRSARLETIAALASALSVPPAELMPEIKAACRRKK